MRSRMRVGAGVLALATIAAMATGCGNDKKENSVDKDSLKGENVEVMAVWTGAEQAAFQKVLDRFSKDTGATVTYTSAGDNIATVLGNRVAGGSPPAVAVLPQPGLLKELAKKGSLKVVDDKTKTNIEANYAQVWKDLGEAEDNQLYGVWLKAAEKSLGWYRPAAFTQAGVEAPKTWDDLTRSVKTLADSGQTPLSVAGGSGWTLTDFFENTYLRSAGKDMYNKLAAHEIKYTDESVKKALKAMGDLWATPNAIVSGTAGAQQVEFPRSVTNVFGTNPTGAMVFEGDFVSGVIKSETQSKVGDTAKFFAFPSIDAAHANGVVAGGDVAVQMSDSKGAKGLMQFLATTAAAEEWAKQGGFLSPNKELDQSVYPDDPTREIAKLLVDAGDNTVFDMSDLQPAAFGGTPAQGEWKILQDFLANPTQVDQTADKLEAAAAAAYNK